MSIIKRLIAWAFGTGKKAVAAIPTVEIKIKVDPYSRQHFNSNGTFKSKYPSMERAEMARDRMADKTGFKFAAYQCRICDSYHIGKAFK